MNNIQEEMAQLIALTKLYLQEEYEQGDWIGASEEAFASLKAFAKNRKSASPAKPSQPAKPAFSSSIPKPQPARRPYSPPPKASRPPVRKEPVETKQEKPATSPGSFTQEKSEAPPSEDFADLRKLMQKNFPNQKVLDHPPAPSTEKKHAVPQALILSEGTSGPAALFLKNLAKAVQLCICPAAVVAPNDASPGGTVKMILGTQDLLEKCAAQFPDAASVPLLPFEDYADHPEKKSQLWNTIQEKASPSRSNV